MAKYDIEVSHPIKGGGIECRRLAMLEADNVEELLKGWSSEYTRTT